MPAATLTLRDNFNRANAALSTGYAANAVLSATIPQVISNQCGATSAFIGFVRTGETLGADQGIRFTWSTMSTQSLGVWIRGTGLTLDNSTTQALVVFMAKSGSYQYLSLYQYTDAGGYVALEEHDPWSGTFPAAGSAMQVQIVGTAVEIYDDGVLMATLSAAGTTVTSGPQVGIEFQSTVDRIDDLYTGNLATSMSRTGADSIGLADTAARIVSRARAASEALAIADSGARVVARGRAAAESVAVSDSTSRAVARARSGSDTIAVSDAATRSVARPRTASETLAIGDAPTRGAVGTARTAADSISVSDAAGRSVARVRSSADAISIADSAARAFAATRSGNDSIGLDETVSVSTAGSYTRTGSDSIAISESASRTLSRTRTATETLSIGDSPVRAVGRPRTTSDALAITDSAGTTSSRTRTGSDGLAITDSAGAGALHMARSGGDTITVTETPARGPVAMVRIEVEYIVITDVGQLRRRAAIHGPADAGWVAAAGRGRVLNIFDRGRPVAAAAGRVIGA